MLRDRAVYGVDSIDEWFESVKASVTYRLGGGIPMIAMSELSDAQEELQFDTDAARKTINRAKFLISNLMGE